MGADGVVGDSGNGAPLLGRSVELARFDALLDRAARDARGTATGKEFGDSGRSGSSTSPVRQASARVGCSARSAHGRADAE